VCSRSARHAYIPITRQKSTSLPRQVAANSKKDSSASSSSSDSSTADASGNHPQNLPVIAVGSFGVIHAGTLNTIYNCALNPADSILGSASPLQQEYDHHVALATAITIWNRTHPSTPLHVRIPHPLAFLEPTGLYAQAWWATHLNSVGACDAAPPPKVPQPLLQATRIPAIPQFLRRRLTDLYWPISTHADAHASAVAVAEGPCLLRLCLRKDSGDARCLALPTSLRGFRLTPTRMQRLGIDPVWVTRELGRALAVVHWGVRRDGRGVESVVGGADVVVDEFSERVVRWSEVPTGDASLKTVVGGSGRTVGERWVSVARGGMGGVDGREGHEETGVEMTAGLGVNTLDDNQEQDWSEAGVASMPGGHRVAIYMLDFNDCSTVTLDEVGVKKCVDAFYVNDSYFPSPPLPESEDRYVNGVQSMLEVKEKLWVTFEKAYLVTASEVTQDLAEEERTKVRDCSKAFVAGVKDQWAEIGAKREGVMEREMETEVERPTKSAEENQVTETKVKSPYRVIRDPSMYFGTPKRAIDPAWGFS
jgi:hypothetical protein